MSQDTLVLSVAVVGFVLVLIGIAWWTVAQWTECREIGMSFLYCLKHIS